MSRTSKIALAVLLLIGLAGFAFAQGGATGAITGSVEDPTGSAVVGANVRIISEATGQMVRQLKADSSGAFTATLLPVGTYSVEVSAPGFATTKFPGVEVRITETTRLTAAVKPSVQTEIVEVQSQAQAVNTTDATTGQSIASATITDLPLATRNFQQLLDLSAGATANLNNAASLGRGDVRIDVNGGREDNNNYLIEGVSASDYSFGELTYTPVPNPDDIQEFKVSTSLYDATQGRNGGGNINAVLKSGTANFHGDLWEYFRNSDLDANDYFLGPFVLKQNIFGGDFGGPVGPKAKLGYFYVNYQGTRQRSGDSLGTYVNTSIPILPTNRSAANLMSVFSSPAVPGCPAVNLPGIDPVALAVLNVTGNQFGSTPGGFLVPTVPGTPGVTQTFNAATGTCSSTVNYGPFKLTDPGRYRDDQFTANWDRDFNRGKDRLSWRFFWSDAQTFEPFGADNLQVQTGYPANATNLNFPLNVPLRGRFGSIAETHSFSNNLINEFRFGVNVISDALQNVPVPGTSPAALGISSVGTPDMYRFQFNTWQLGPFPNQPQSALSDSLVWLDTLSWTRGHHSFRFGGEIDRTSIRRNLPVLDNGLFYFTDGNAISTSITDFQNFLEGYTSLGEAGGGDSNHDYHLPGFAAFVQDDYRIRTDLTLNLGFRTEWVGAANDSLCHLGNAVLQNPVLAQPFVWPNCVSKYGISGVSGTLNGAALNNEYATVPEPRIGLAYDVAGKHKTVVRAGYGIYSVREDIGAVDNLSFTAPFFPLSGGPNTPISSGGLGMGCMFNSAATSFCPGAGPFPLPALGAAPSAAYAPAASVFQGFPGGSTSGSPTYSGNVDGLFALAVPLHWVVPTTQQWNLTVQRQLGGNWVLEVGYVGTKGTRLRSTFDPDQPTLASPTSPVTLTCGSIAAGVPCLQPGVATGAPVQITTNTADNALARAPYQPVNPVLLEAFYPNSDSHYGSLQATLSHRFSKGLYLQSAYTFSKSIDDVSTASVAFVTRVNNQDSGAASRGLSDFDHPQRFVTSLNYALPFLANRHDAAGYALGGWEVDSVVVAQSGSPITIFDSNGAGAYTLASFPVATANFAPGFNCSNALNTGPMAAKIANWVNPLAYQSAPVVPDSPDGATGYGDSPRNCILGPRQVNFDLTLAKTFKIGEKQSLRFRTEFFNLFNHPSFQNPLGTGNANVAAGPAAIGEITQTNGTPRLIQFSLKYSF
ncbi:MAG TPA: carboxypeptidase-like regulatory domain-containing protein [Terriglobales bacterium]|nr:carboxypeptidase-like regulatory domain-containing protein [Terriglobales bacterium]